MVGNQVEIKGGKEGQERIYDCIKIHRYFFGTNFNIPIVKEYTTVLTTMMIIFTNVLWNDFVRIYCVIKPKCVLSF